MSDHEQVHPSSLAGAVVLVTGASSGIGAAAARELHRIGAMPVLVARRSELLEELSVELGGALSVPTDVTDPSAITSLIRRVLDHHGRVDGLINNAGASLHIPWADVELSHLRSALELNFVAYVTMMQAVLPSMRSQGRGSIVNVGSGTTRILAPGMGPYTATKAAVAAMSLTAAKELAEHGITVSLVSPSVTATEFRGGMYQSANTVPDGMTAHSPDHVARHLIQAMITGVPQIDIPHGPEQPIAAAGLIAPGRSR